MPVTLRPRASLGRVLDDLGATLLDLVHGDAGAGAATSAASSSTTRSTSRSCRSTRSSSASGVDEPDAGRRACCGELGRQRRRRAGRCAPRCRLTDEVRAAADASGVALLGLSRGASWAHLAALLRSLLAEGDVGDAEPESLGGLPSGDLFAVANAIAVAARRPDHHRGPQLAGARVLRPPGRGRPVPRRDDPRPAGARAVLPDRSPSAASSATCYRSDQPVFVEPPMPDGDGVLDAARRDRRARRRRGARLDLGRGARAAQRRSAPQALRDAAKLVALHLLRVRAGADVQRRLRADLLSTALEGGAGAREALDRLGLAGPAAVVLGVAMCRARRRRRTRDRRRRGRARAAAAQRRASRCT